MAVIDDIAGLEVEIIVDGEALREYDNVDALEDDHKTVVRYVVAEPGKEFAVRMRSTNAFELGWPLWDLCARLYVDGKRVKGALLDQVSTRYLNKTFDGVDEDQGNGRWVKRKFLFSELVFGMAIIHCERI